MDVRLPHSVRHLAVPSTEEEGAAPMAAGAAEKVKVTVNMTPEDVEMLKALAGKRGISMTEVLRRALAMEKFLEDSSEAGEKILIQGPDQTVRQLVIR
jgi:Ribbon-helix-helix protein, copG family